MRLMYRTEYRTFFRGRGRGGGAYWKGGAYSKFQALGGALIGSWALIRAFTVFVNPTI